MNLQGELPLCFIANEGDVDIGIIRPDSLSYPIEGLDL